MSQTIEDVERTTMARVTWRLLPFLLLLYIISWLDRVNVGFAKLQMNADFGFSETIYSLGAGIFFIGYALCEIPSNLILVRVGARLWIARIMITWGLISAGTMFVQGPTSFYVMRFLLGVAEAGFLPGIIYYLSEWFPREQRARAVSWFMIGIPLSVVFGCIWWKVFRPPCSVSWYWPFSPTSPPMRIGSRRSSGTGSASVWRRNARRPRRGMASGSDNPCVTPRSGCWRSSCSVARPAATA
jgi:MFS family permease